MKARFCRGFGFWLRPSPRKTTPETAPTTPHHAPARRAGKPPAKPPLSQKTASKTAALPENRQQNRRPPRKPPAKPPPSQKTASKTAALPENRQQKRRPPQNRPPPQVNLALKALPTFKCLPQPLGQHGTTTHLLPDESEVVDVITQGFRDVQEGRLPEFPTIEWYFHTTVDPSVQDPAGHHSSALFVQWVPFELAGTTWEAEEARYVDKLLAICDRFAPGTSDLVADTFTLTPPKIESYFGITRGHIHHVDNGFGFDQRFPYRTPMEGLYSASAGTHPAGSVIGAAGHNCAAEVVRDLGLKPHWATA